MMRSGRTKEEIHAAVNYVTSLCATEVASCWKEDVLVISISDKFLRLTLQLISRYANWLSAGLSARRTRNLGSNSPFEWALAAAPDDLIINDLDNLAGEICVGNVFEVLNSCSTEVLDLVKSSILQGGKSVIPSVIDSVIVEKSNEELKQLHGIVAAYRMTKKPPPVRHSHYVAGVFFWMPSEARKTETSLQRIRLGAQRRAGATLDVSDHNVSETDRICMQLFLHIQLMRKKMVNSAKEGMKRKQPHKKFVESCMMLLLIWILIQQCVMFSILLQVNQGIKPIKYVEFCVYRLQNESSL
ncbi:hypothetical protein L1987_58927 [Smallanthus sonchifolius]|uniref:Uncharacterized protein n=1 Tax=Smallanthus sonchifolius TaxID=185202 RepID=A0ACB9D432_9ASTR|nr:hypothetical protein L1987_58927 [Smallanthus sonchifolius]